jgi:hypothetical protein
MHDYVDLAGRDAVTNICNAGHTKQTFMARILGTIAFKLDHAFLFLISTQLDSFLLGTKKERVLTLTLSVLILFFIMLPFSKVC